MMHQMKQIKDTNIFRCSHCGRELEIKVNPFRRRVIKRGNELVEHQGVGMLIELTVRDDELAELFDIWRDW
jgi:uncharacterized protein Veg